MQNLKLTGKKAILNKENGSALGSLVQLLGVVAIAGGLIFFYQQRVDRSPQTEHEPFKPAPKTETVAVEVAAEPVVAITTPVAEPFSAQPTQEMSAQTPEPAPLAVIPAIRTPSPIDRPELVKLTQPTRFDVESQLGGAGFVELPAGVTVKVVEVHQTSLTVEYRGSKKVIPMEHTDLFTQN